MRERSIVFPCSRAMRSIASSTAESIPRPSRSIFRKPASPQLSLSHWQIWRPAIAAGCTGTRSISGLVEITIPPGCWLMCRGRPATAAGRARVTGTSRPAHIERALSGELEHLPVQQEETGQPKARNQLQLAVEPFARALLVPVRACVPLRECPVADLAQLHVGGIDAVGEVRVAIAELLREVELAAIGDLARTQRRLPWQPVEHLRGRAQNALVVAAPLPLATVERRAVLDRDERVLQARPAHVVRVHVAGCDGGNVQRLGKVDE